MLRQPQLPHRQPPQTNRMINRRKVPAVMLVTLFLLVAIGFEPCTGHGRLIEPPSRASAWRYGFSTPPNYNDHELYCGGFNRQWQKNDGKCGECGDPFDVPLPRPHEFGGKWGQGVIVRRYKPGATITLRVELTASHMGYFEFRICDNVQAKQDCLDKHLMRIASGTPSIAHANDLKTRFYPRNGSRIYDMKAELPADLECNNCVVQWKYVAGNNWGICPDGNGAVGCGPQEEFRACSDVYVGVKEGQDNRTPLRPGQKPSPTRGPDASTEPSTTDEPIEEPPKGVQYMGPLVAIISLFLVLCGFAAVYIYHYHGGRIKALMRWNREKAQKSAHLEPPSHHLATDVEANAPVPPPRTKRISNQFRDIDAQESSVLSGSTKRPSPLEIGVNRKPGGGD